MTFAQAKVDKLAVDLVEKLEGMEQQLTVTGYLSKWTVSVGCLFAVVAVLAAAGGYTMGNFVGSLGLGRQNIDENVWSPSRRGKTVRRSL